MEKKFKNQLAILGQVSLKEAFIKELSELGYQAHPRSIGFSYPDYPVQVNQYGGNGIYGVWSNINHSGYSPIILTLPQDWNKALQLASEVEEQVPEYAECTLSNPIGPESFTKGKIYKVEGVHPKYPDMYLIEKDNLGSNTNGWYKKNFIPSTKEKFEAQQNAPKYKAGQFLEYDGALFFITDSKKNEDSRMEYFYNTQIGNSIYHIGEKRSFFSAPPGGIDGSTTIHNSARIVPDYEALKLLKEYYAKQGVVEGARITVKGSYSQPIIRGFGLVKNTNWIQNWPGLGHGNSQLAILIGEYYKYYVTPTIDGFRVLPKEVKVAGYSVIYANGSEVKIGCKYFTKDSLITIRDLIIHGHNGAHTFAHFNLSGVGNIKVTVDELNAAIELFDR